MRRAGFSSDDIAAMDVEEFDDSLQAARLYLRKERADFFEAMLFATRATNYDSYARREDNAISVGLGLNEVTPEDVEKARKMRRGWRFKRGG